MAKRIEAAKIIFLSSLIVMMAAPVRAQRSIGFHTVAEALESLQHQPNMTSQTNADGFLTLSDPNGSTIWSFAPKSDSAYPAVVRRDIIDRDDGIYIDMHVLCEASDDACRKLVERFKAANAEIRRKTMTSKP